MEKILQIELKPLERDDPETCRIYSLTRESVEHLNNYIKDFLETIVIQKENIEKFKKDKNKEKIIEADESIKFVEKTIENVFLSMKQIESDMPGFVEIKEVKV